MHADAAGALLRAVHAAGVELHDAVGVRQAAVADARLLGIELDDVDAGDQRVEHVLALRHHREGRLARRSAGRRSCTVAVGRGDDDRLAGCCRHSRGPGRWSGAAHCAGAPAQRRPASVRSARIRAAIHLVWTWRLPRQGCAARASAAKCSANPVAVIDGQRCRGGYDPFGSTHRQPTPISHRHHPRGRRARCTRPPSALRSSARPDGSAGGPEIFLKLETLQPIGSFKIRGAYNAVRRLPPEQLAGGVWTVSAGNAAQGVALAARNAGARAACS